MSGFLPRWAGVAAIAVLALPLLGLLSRVDWSRALGLLTAPSALVALQLSLWTALAATIISMLIGLPVALVLARGAIPPPVLAVVRPLVLLPLVLPPVVGGIVLLATYGRRGLIGSLVLPFGIEIGFTTVAVVLAQVFVAMPFFILSVEGAVRAGGIEHEATATSLGAGPTRVLVTITLPLIRPSLITGAVLTFARALGEFGATITFAGSLQGVTRTLPLEIYLQREVDPDAAIALSLLLVVVATVIVAVAYRAPGGPGAWRRDAEPLAPGGSVPTRRPPAVRAEAGSERMAAGSGAADAASLDLAAAGLADQEDRTSLRLEARIVLERRDIDVEFVAEPGETIALIGPNGAGKSSCLDAVAGLIPLDGGRIRLGGRILDDPGAGRRIPANERRTARLGQRSRLFPHLTLEQNVAYGPVSQGASRADALATARALLERVGLAGLGGRRPGEVSGGQEQRGAIARALALDPRVFLWDEPFAALDVTTTPGHRDLLRIARGGRTALLVTHDPADVVALADRVIVLEHGRIVQDAPLAQFLADPAPGFAARFVASGQLGGEA